jgi:hypothetical protein
MRVNGEGTISEVKYDGIADRAQLTPGQKLIGVNGEVFSTDALRQAIDDAKGTSKPIALMVQDDTHLTTINLDYHDGQRFPSLQRIESTTDYLDEITKPLAALQAPVARQSPNLLTPEEIYSQLKAVQESRQRAQYTSSQ